MRWMFSRRLLQFSLSFDRAANKLACYMRARVFVAPCEPFATSPPYRAACAPDARPFLERFQHASRKVREDFTFANGQADEALPIRAQHLRRHPALADLDELLFPLPLFDPDGFLPADHVADDELFPAGYPLGHVLASPPQKSVFLCLRQVVNDGIKFS